MNLLPKELTEQQRQFIDALLENGGHVTKAAEASGFTKTYGYALMKVLQDEIKEAAENFLTLHAIRAVNVIADGMEGQLGMSTNSRIEAAKQLLDRIGIVKKEKVEINGPAGGIFILPPKQP